MIPGELLAEPGELELNAGRADDHAGRRQHRRPADPGRLALPFLRNQRRRCSFDREAARGFRLDIAAGTAVRFEPGQTRTVQLVALAGDRKVYGFRGLIQGALMSTKITRQAYAEMFGPTTGDRVRLADTELIIEVEKDFTIYGEEVKFGGGKVIRDGMGQGQRVSAETRRYRHHQRADRRCRGRHHQGRHRPQGRPHRRHRQGRQSGHPARRRPSSSAPAPKSSPAKA